MASPPLSAAPGWDPASPPGELEAAIVRLKRARLFDDFPDDEDMRRRADDWSAFTGPYSDLLRGAARGVPLAMAALVRMLVWKEFRTFDDCIPEEGADVVCGKTCITGINLAGERRAITRWGEASCSCP